MPLRLSMPLCFLLLPLEVDGQAADVQQMTWKSTDGSFSPLSGHRQQIHKQCIYDPLIVTHNLDGLVLYFVHTKRNTTKLKIHCSSPLSIIYLSIHPPIRFGL